MDLLPPVELEAFWEEERLEAAAFARSHGTVSLEEIRGNLEQALDGRHRAILADIQEQLQPLDTVIRSLPAVQRLHQLSQLGKKLVPSFDPRSPPIAYYPTLHTRYGHCELGAELAVVAGVQLGLPQEYIKTSFAAFWLHDIGHPAFGHCGDELLQEYGYPDHESRGLELLFSSSIRSFLEQQGVKVGKVADVIQEKGSLGVLQKLLDPLSYVILDSIAQGRQRYPDFGASFLANIEGIFHDTIVVLEISEVQRLLEYRAEMMRDLYYHPTNKMIDEARRQLLRLALQKGVLSLEQLRDGGDDQLQLYLQSLVQHDLGAALLAGRRTADNPLARYKDLYSLSLGILPEGWSSRGFDSLPTLDEFFFRHQSTLSGMDFVVQPFDYTAKSVRILSPDLQEHTLQAKDITLRPEDIIYILYTPHEEKPPQNI